MKYLLGIDDTDNLESRGTGHLVRQLANHLNAAGLARPLGITRHQLLVSPEIPYTSHNSSACLSVDCDAEWVGALWESAGTYLTQTAAPDADVGLGLAEHDRVSPEAIEFGSRAKREVLEAGEAQSTAVGSAIQLAGLTGTGGGVIGALAAIGLRAGGEDGRFLWLPGLRELKGKLPGDVIRKHGVERICSLDGNELPAEALVDIGDWIRPVLRGGLATLYVEEQDHEWHILSKERIKSLSD